MKLKEMFKAKILFKYHVETITEQLLIVLGIYILGEEEKQLSSIKDSAVTEILNFRKNQRKLNFLLKKELKKFLAVLFIQLCLL